MVVSGEVDFVASAAEGAVSSGIFNKLSGRRFVPPRRTLQNNAAQEGPGRAVAGLPQFRATGNYFDWTTKRRNVHPTLVRDGDDRTSDRSARDKWHGDAQNPGGCLHRRALHHREAP